MVRSNMTRQQAIDALVAGKIIFCGAQNLSYDVETNTGHMWCQSECCNEYEDNLEDTLRYAFLGKDTAEGWEVYN